MINIFNLYVKPRNTVYVPVLLVIFGQCFLIVLHSSSLIAEQGLLADFLVPVVLEF